jgi:hypothetical protein
MNWFVRNVVVVLFGAATSIATVAYLLYLEAANGQALFSYNGLAIANYPILAYVPIGAIAAGFTGAIGYLVISLILRVRPANIVLFSILAVSAAMVYLAQSAEMELWMGAKGTTKNALTFSRFLASSMIHSPVHFWSTGDGDSTASYTSTSFAPGSSPAAPRISSGGNSSVDGISSGVGGMLASQDASKAGPVQQLNQMGEGVQSIGSGVSAHGSQWLLAALQALGFAIGSLVVFFHLRSLTHCEDCMLLLSKKGEQTRYYIRTPEMRNSVDDVMSKARERHLRESIQAHMAKGSDQKTKWAEYFSILEISRCTQCQAHRLNYRTFRKEGSSWKDIALMGFTATTIEPLDFA